MIRVPFWWELLLPFLHYILWFLVHAKIMVARLHKELSKLDADLRDCIMGLVMCFFGGTFIALVSAWEVCMYVSA